MIKITLDNSCFHENSWNLLSGLAELKKDGNVELIISHITNSELFAGRPKNKSDMEKMYKFRSIVKVWNITSVIPKELSGMPDEENKFMEEVKGYTKSGIDKIFKKIVEIIFPEGWSGNERNGLNNYIDIKVLAQHIVRGGGIFVTKDEKLFFKNTNKGVTNKLIEDEFPNTKIRLLNEDVPIEIQKLILKN